MHRFLRLLTLITALLVSIAPLSAETLQQAPLNPAFVQYQQQTMKAAGADTPLRHTGRTPSPIDLSHLAGKSLSSSEGPKTAATYPAQYDLREEGFVTAVKSQNPYGDCWTFAAMASMESTAMKLLGAQDPDLSEWELTYYGYIDESDELVGFGNVDSGDFPSPVANFGGDDFKATAILSRWTGAALESDVPFATTPFPTGATCAYHLNDVMFLYYDSSSRYAPVSIENLKYALTHYGAVSVGVCAEFGLDDPLFWNGLTNASYIPADNSHGLEVGYADHAVAIVGWDDNYSADNFATTPPGNGAWIVRNSWGANWGDEGYFYLSYHDAVLDTGAAYISAPADNFEHIYQYDPLGLCNMQGIPEDLTPETAWMANVFVAEGLQALKAVSFYAPAVDTAYEISVFTNADNADPTSGDLTLFAQTGTLHVPGYRTVELDTPVLLSAGQTFSIVVKLTTPGYNFPIAMEFAMVNEYYDYSGKASANPGESFFSDDGISWTDTTVEDSTRNVCLKAFTDDIKLSPNEGEILPPLASEASADAAFSGFQGELDAASEDILAILGDYAIPGTVQLLGSKPEEFRTGEVPAPLTVNYDQAVTTSGNRISSPLLVAFNHNEGRYVVPSGSAISAGSLRASAAIAFEDGSDFDGGPAGDGKLTDLRLMEVTVQADVDETPTTGGGGGCNMGTFAPGALFLLVPLALLRKR